MLKGNDTMNENSFKGWRFYYSMLMLQGRRFVSLSQKLMTL